MCVPVCRAMCVAECVYNCMYDYLGLYVLLPICVTIKVFIYTYIYIYDCVDDMLDVGIVSTILHMNVAVCNSEYVCVQMTFWFIIFLESLIKKSPGGLVDNRERWSKNTSI